MNQVDWFELFWVNNPWYHVVPQLIVCVCTSSLRVFRYVYLVLWCYSNFNVVLQLSDRCGGCCGRSYGNGYSSGGGGGGGGAGLLAGMENQIYVYEFIMETEPSYEFSFHLFKCLEMISGSLQIYK